MNYLIHAICYHFLFIFKNAKQKIEINKNCKERLPSGKYKKVSISLPQSENKICIANGR